MSLRMEDTAPASDSSPETDSVTASDGRPTAQPWLVALDIDGTLVHYDQTMTSAVRTAVRAVADAGHHVVLASGRSLVGVLPVARMLALTQGQVVCSNGAVTVRLDQSLTDGFEVTQALTFDPGPALRLLAQHLPEAKFAVEDVGVGFRLTDLFPEGELSGEHRVVGLEDLWSGEVTRVVVRGGDHSSQEFAQRIAHIGLHGCEWTVGYTAWMDLAPVGVNKARTLEEVRQRLGVPHERTLALGDGNNDIEMLQWAARGVAMGQASEQVKAAASEVTASIDDNGAVPVLASLL